MKKNKLFTGIMTTACAAAILITGTLALTGHASTKVNRFTSGSDTPIGPTIVDEFPGTHDANGVYAKSIFVDNSEGSNSVYVRVKLQDLLQKDSAVAPTGAEDTWAWRDHTPTADPAVCNTLTAKTNHHDWFVWEMGEKVHVGLDPNAATGYWIYDAGDGYAYWSQALKPGDKTTQLLRSVQAKQLDKNDYFYAIRGLMEFVSNDDGSDDPNKTWITGTTGQIKNADIRKYFEDLFKSVTPPPALTYSNPVMTLSNKTPAVGSATTAGATVSFTGSDSKTYVGTIKSATPAVYAADTTTVSYTVADPSGKDATVPVKLSDAGVVVDVTPSPVSRVTITGPNTVEKDATIKLTATTVPSDSGATIIWRSNKISVAMVDGDGVVTGTGAGTANITATADGVTSTAHVVTVTDSTAGLIKHGDKYYKMIATYNNLYQDMGADGKNPGDFLYAANGSMDDFRAVMYYPTDWVLKAASKYDVPYDMSADYYVNVMGPMVPLAPTASGVSGLDYNHAFLVDSKGGIGTQGCTGAYVVPDVRIK